MESRKSSIDIYWNIFSLDHINNVHRWRELMQPMKVPGRFWLGEFEAACSTLQAVILDTNIEPQNSPGIAAVGIDVMDHIPFLFQKGWLPIQDTFAQYWTFCTWTLIDGKTLIHSEKVQLFRARNIKKPGFGTWVRRRWVLRLKQRWEAPGVCPQVKYFLSALALYLALFNISWLHSLLALLPFRFFSLSSVWKPCLTVSPWFSGGIAKSSLRRKRTVGLCWSPPLGARFGSRSQVTSRLPKTCRTCSKTQKKGLKAHDVYPIVSSNRPKLYPKDTNSASFSGISVKSSGDSKRWIWVLLPVASASPGCWLRCAEAWMTWSVSMTLPHGDALDINNWYYIYLWILVKLCKSWIIGS